MNRILIKLLFLLFIPCVAGAFPAADKPLVKKKTVKGKQETVKEKKNTTHKSVAKVDTIVLKRVATVHVPTLIPVTDSMLLAWVNFLTPTPAKKLQDRIEGNISLDYSRGQKAKFDEKNNAEAMYKLQSVMRPLKDNPDITVTGIKIVGYTSPDGDYRMNERNGMQRALSLTDYIRKHKCFGSVPFEVNWVAEDWSKLTRLIETSDMPFRASVLDIIHSVDVVDGREKTLMELANGVPYHYMDSYFFSQLRRLEYEITYKKRNATTPEVANVSVRSGGLTLSEFYTMAQTYPTGSAEFNDIIDLAGRLFPESSVACINAAAVALMKKDMDRAKNYLEPFATLSDAGNNMGILCLLEGNYDKAEVYLELAVASGITQAVGALNYLKANRNK